jgi:hypothetical protein
MHLSLTFSHLSPSLVVYQRKSEFAMSRKRKSWCTSSNDENSTSDEESSEIDYPDTPRSLQLSDDGEENEEQSEVSEDDDENNDIVHSRIPVTRRTECAICCHTFLALCSSVTGEPLSVADLSRYTLDSFMDPHEERLSTRYQIIGPCGNPTHTFCVGCVRRLCLVRTDETFRTFHGNCPCLSSTHNEQCRDPFQRLFVYGASSLSYFFTPVEQSFLHEKSARYLNLHHHTLVTTTSRRNHYSWSNPFTRESLVEQFRHLLTSDKMEIRCKECHTFLEKTTQCNAVSHCGWETCYCCGYSDVVIPSYHWKQCPRYNSDYKKVVKEYTCQEGQCYNDDHCCGVKDHQPGIHLVIEKRRTSHIHSLWTSLPECFQKEMHKCLPELSDFLMPS